MGLFTPPLFTQHVFTLPAGQNVSWYTGAQAHTHLLVLDWEGLMGLVSGGSSGDGGS